MIHKLDFFSENSSLFYRDLTKRQRNIGLALIMVLAIIYSRLLYAPCDDAYIFYVYAKNFVQGNGLTFNGTIVQGFTSMLWVILLAFIGLFKVPIHIIGEVLSTISGCAALLATYSLSRSFSFSRWQSLIPSALLAVTGDFAFYMPVGLEQTLFVALVALSTTLVIRSPQPSLFRILTTGIVMAIMVLTRPEGALFCAGLLAFWAYRLQSIRVPFYSGIVLTAIVLPILLIFRNYYGDWLPNTYYVKSNTGFANLYHGIIYLVKSVIRYGFVVVIGLSLLFMYIKKKEYQNIHDLLVLLGLTILWTLYVTLQGGDNMVGGRMLIPILPLIYVALLFLAVSLSAKYLVPASVLLGMGLIISFMSDPWVRQQAAHWREDFEIRRNAGIYLRNNFPPNTILALNPAGIIPYYSELPTIDMLGLNNKHIAHQGSRDTRLRFGHQIGDGEYVLSQQPDVILFRGTPSATPGKGISEQEIWASPQFHTEYFPVFWDNIGTAYVRRNSESSSE